jgi:hypothetical protein
VKPIETDVIDNGQYGSLLYTLEFEQSPSALPPEALTGKAEPLPKKVTLDNLPSVAMQGALSHLGSPGSCEAQSFGYCLGSYTAARNPDGTPRWDASQAENQISAAHQYALEHKAEGAVCPKGSQAIPYLDRLIAYGAPNIFEVPYYPLCSYLNAIDLDKTYPNATQFRLGSLAAFSIKNDPDAAVLLIKKLLATGNAVAFSGPVLVGYDNPILQDGVMTETSSVPKSGHGQTVVGYDDEIGPAGNKGAFLIQNSFGEQWPPKPNSSKASPGRLYWSYKTFQTQSLAATAYPVETGPLTGFTLTTASEPAGSVNRAYQWAPSDQDGVWFIAMLQFAWAVTLTQVIFTEPGTGTTVSGLYGRNINNGYVYVKRTDGNQFVDGEWGIQLFGLDLDDTKIDYIAALTIKRAEGSSLPAIAISAATPITDTTGKPATITVGS